MADIGHSSADAGTLSLPFLEENECQSSIESRVFIYLFNDFTHYFCGIQLLYHFLYSTLYEHITILYTQLLIPVILLTSTVDIFVLLIAWSRTRAIYSAMPTLYP